MFTESLKYSIYTLLTFSFVLKYFIFGNIIVRCLYYFKNKLCIIIYLKLNNWEVVLIFFILTDS